MQKNKIEYKLFNLSTEYPHFVGQARWAIISDLSEQELLGRYEELKQHSPFVLFTSQLWQLIEEAFHESELNEHKHYMRTIRKHDLFGYVDGETELFLLEKEKDITIDKLIKKTDSEQLFKAMDTLTQIQKRRVELYYFYGLTLQEIANIDTVSVKQIHKSINLALEKIKKFLK